MDTVWTKEKLAELKAAEDELMAWGEQAEYRQEHIGYIIYLLRHGVFTTQKVNRIDAKRAIELAAESLQDPEDSILQFWIMPTTSRHNALKAAKADHEKTLVGTSNYDM